MVLIQILLPLFGADGRRIPRSTFQHSAKDLVREFGGLTAYTHAPAEGLWRPRNRRTERDQIVVYEVMAKRLMRTKWRVRRRTLEAQYRQETIVVRVLHVELL